MSLPLEAISVVIRSASIQERVEGGQEAIRRLANQTWRNGDGLAIASFQNALSVTIFVTDIVTRGLRKSTKHSALDYVIVDRFDGPASHCPWIDVLDNYSVELAFRPDLRRRQKVTTVTPEIDRYREVLWEAWNPLNLDRENWSEVEYDSYIPGMIELSKLVKSCHLERYLVWIETQMMALKADYYRAADVSRSLLNI